MNYGEKNLTFLILKNNAIVAPVFLNALLNTLHNRHAQLTQSQIPFSLPPHIDTPTHTYTFFFDAPTLSLSTPDLTI